MDKKQLVRKIIEQLEQELATTVAAAKAAREAATHEESKPEDEHDTRGVEASYLAGAQANRAEQLQHQITAYRSLPFREFTSKDAIAPGALIELDLDGKKLLYFLVPQGGGISVVLDGRTVNVITPQAPLGEELLGKIVGDIAEIEAQKQVREYEVVAVF